jgi:hypothetical protein
MKSVDFIAKIATKISLRKKRRQSRDPWQWETPLVMQWATGDWRQ